MKLIRELSDIDGNFKIESVGEKKVEWHSLSDDKFRLTGVFFDEETKMYRRFPKQIGDKISDSIVKVASHTAGGRLSFKTNSPFVAIRAVVPYASIPNHMTVMGYYGFSVYSNGCYAGTSFPDWREVVKKGDVISFEYDSMKKIPFENVVNVTRMVNTSDINDIDIYFPNYNGVLEVYIGLEENSIIRGPEPFSYGKKVVFYGSSIEQGASASHPGNDYINLISSEMNVEVMNLGFSGNCKGQPEFAKFLASIDAGLYVVAYDYNAITHEELEANHYNFYKTLRAVNKTTPILFTTRPNIELNESVEKRRQIVYDTYKKGVEAGDKNLYFADGALFFGKKFRRACTVDGCHPTDLGFSRMAENIMPLIKDIMSKNKI